MEIQILKIRFSCYLFFFVVILLLVCYTMRWYRENIWKNEDKISVMQPILSFNDLGMTFDMF